MSKRTRLFLSVAAGILVVGLGTGLLASFMGFQALTLAGASTPEFAYVPRDVQFLAFANVRNVMDSELRRKLTELKPDVENGADQLKQHTGIDVRTDIDSVLATWLSPPGGEGGPPLVIARGRFDDAQIESLITAQGGRAEDYKGKRLLLHEQEMFAVVFLEPGLAAIGSPASVRTAIDTQMSGNDVNGNDELMRLTGDINDGSVWAVARFDALVRPLPADVATQLPAISWFSAKGFIDSGVQGQLRVEARDEESARNLQDVVRGFVALARLQVSQQAGLAQVLDSLLLSGEGKTVSLSFSVPSELIVDTLGAAIRAGGQKPSTEPFLAPAPEPAPAPAL
ncbi:MAG TPA: hypothetical protein VFO58_10625 [Vicinamibacterales bacterium]|nr:hypothetical protein [Vicinamibacterales bacterium]